MPFIRKHKRNGRIYLAEVENRRVDGKVVQKFIRYVGVEPNSERSAFPTCNNLLVASAGASQLAMHSCS